MLNKEAILMRKVIVRIFMFVLLCMVPVLAWAGERSSHAVGAGFRFGPFSFLGTDISYQFYISDRAALLAYGGIVADFELFLKKLVNDIK